ncbi:NAD(P) transhydrogenase subunit beta [Bradyrhizobium sp. i1.3.1]
MSANLSAFLYLVAGVLFILSLRGLSSPASSRQGNLFGMIGMAIAVATTLANHPPADGLAWVLVIVGIAIGGGIGAVIARRVPMTSMPELVAAFHSLVGMAAVLVAAGAFYAPEAFDIGTPGNIHPQSLVEMSLGVAIGALTFTGSVIAFLKLSARMSGAPIILPFRHVINIALAIALVVFIVGLVMSGSALDFWLIVIIALALGVLMIIPIGGADMPVVISMLNSYSGWAAAGIGFTLGNSALIITGALVGSSGAILSYIMCHAMNRSFISVILGGFGGETAAAGAGGGEQKPAKLGSADDAAFIMKNAQKVIIVPGYGMAVAQAQHALREMGDILKKEGVEVKYAIHPVAGRMPGHMNVLLAEANVPYDEVFELEDINSEFAQADIAFVIGANDVTNPAAEEDKTSPIYGMPVLQVWKAGTVMFIKRSLASGYAGIDNPLFYRDNTMMLLGDAKKVTENIVKAGCRAGRRADRGPEQGVAPVPSHATEGDARAACRVARCPCGGVRLPRDSLEHPAGRSQTAHEPPQILNSGMAGRDDIPEMDRHHPRGRLPRRSRPVVCQTARHAVSDSDGRAHGACRRGTSRRRRACPDDV